MINVLFCVKYFSVNDYVFIVPEEHECSKRAKLSNNILKHFNQVLCFKTLSLIFSVFQNISRLAFQNFANGLQR